MLAFLKKRKGKSHCASLIWSLFRKNAQCARRNDVSRKVPSKRLDKQGGEDKGWNWAKGQGEK